VRLSRPVGRVRRSLSRWRSRRAGAGGDRGSVAVFTVVFSVAVIFLTALIVDGGNAMNARERAADIAGQAARAAANDISPATLRQGVPAGTAFPIDWNTACGYAQQVVQQYGAGLTGTTVTMSGCPGQNSSPTQAAITVQVTTKPLIGGGILGPFTETATGTANSVCGNAVQQGVC
jgi:Flp pilus assembly protein TadG